VDIWHSSRGGAGHTAVSGHIGVGTSHIHISLRIVDIGNSRNFLVDIGHGSSRSICTGGTHTIVLAGMGTGNLGTLGVGTKTRVDTGHFGVGTSHIHISLRIMNIGHCRDFLVDIWHSSRGGAGHTAVSGHIGVGTSHIHISLRIVDIGNSRNFLVDIGYSSSRSICTGSTHAIVLVGMGTGNLGTLEVSTKTRFDTSHIGVGTSHINISLRIMNIGHGRDFLVDIGNSCGGGASHSGVSRHISVGASHIYISLRVVNIWNSRDFLVDIRHSSSGRVGIGNIVSRNSGVGTSHVNISLRIMNIGHSRDFLVDIWHSYRGGASHGGVSRHIGIGASHIYISLRIMDVGNSRDFLVDIGHSSS